MKNANAISLLGGSTNIQFCEMWNETKFQIDGLTKNVKRLKAVNKSQC